MDNTVISNYSAQRNINAQECACYAPQRSLYIGLRGNVWSCCFNKTHVLGKYPEQSLEEIWHGAQRKNLSEALGSFDFSKGCHGCEALIEAGDYHNLPAKNFDHLSTNPHGFPTKVDFELSNECNLECIMCRGEFSSAIRKNREKLPAIPTAYDRAFLEQLRPFIPHIEHSHFLGGEPFLIPIYLDIWEMMVEHNPDVRISVQTNATILSERVKAILERMQFDMAISIDSFTKKTYEHIRQTASFDKVMANINWFRDYCDRKSTRLTISFCPMTVNWSEIPSVIRQCNDWGVKLFLNTVYHPKELSFSSLTREKLDEIILELSQQTFSTENEIENWNQSSFMGLLGQLKSWRENAKSMHSPSANGNTYADYVRNLSDYLRLNLDTPMAGRELAVAECIDKLDYILIEAELQGVRENAEAKMMEVTFNEMLQSLPTTSKTHLLYLFKSFMLPLTD
ncbi:MAG: hypothetical protein Salg2KO_03690 [Salibacteraceae bacterium]